MRLSGRAWLATPAAIYVDTLRSIPVGDGDLVVLPAHPLICLGRWAARPRR